jgi:hypothetical protein
MDFGADSVRCINLVHRTDKRRDMEALAERLGITIRFFPAVENKEHPHLGCFLSHAKIIKQAYQEGVNRLLVFEDDQIVNPKVPQKAIEEVLRLMDTHPNWEIMNLSGTPDIMLGVVRQFPGHEHIYTGDIFTTGSYILSKRGIERYKDLRLTGVRDTIDRDVFMYNPEHYTVLPPFFKQKDTPTDILGLSLTKTKIRNRYLDLSYVYGRHVRLPLVWLTVALLTAAVLILALPRYQQYRCGKRRRKC